MTQHFALTDREYDTPGTSRGMLDAIKYRYLLSLLVKKGISTRYHGSVLGWVWSYIRPAAQFLMYYLVIGVILGANRGIPLFPVYLFAGIVAVNLFSESLRNTTSAIVDNKALVKKIYLPRELFPLSAVFVALVHFLPQAVILLIVALFLGWKITFIGIIALISGMLLIIVFSLGMGLFFGSVNVAFRDAKNIVDLILMFATWASPVLYGWHMVYEKAPEWLFHFYMVNPMTVGVELSHIAFWLPMVEGQPGSERPSELLTYAIIATVIAVGTLLIGQFVFRKLEGSFAQSL